MKKALVLVLLVLAAGTVFGQTSTAQSAMFNNTAAGNFVIAGSEVYVFNKDVAAAYFANQWDGIVPQPTCTGSKADCAISNMPTAPSAPAPDPKALNPYINQNSCTFYDGGTLDLNGAQPYYNQWVDLSGLNGKGKWEWLFHYTIAIPNPVVEPLTAWALQSSSTTDAVIGVSGFFAGESAQSKSKPTGSANWTYKTSFTILDNGVSRMVSPQYTIKDSNDVVVCGPTDIAVLPVEQGVDFDYTGNAGLNGDSNLLINGLVSSIQNGLLPNGYGKTDDFAGNNTTLGERQSVDTDLTPTCSISAAGSYSLTVTGTMKGVSGSTQAIPLTVGSNLCISAGSCSVCQ